MANQRGRTRTTALVLSALFHLALFVALARVVPGAYPRTPSVAAPVQVDLVPPPLPDFSRSAAPSVSPRPPPPVLRRRTLTEPIARTVQTPPVHRKREPPVSRPMPPPPARAPAAPTPTTAAGRPGNVQGAPPAFTAGPPSPPALPASPRGGGVTEALRTTVGCSHEDFLHLTTAERAACDRQFGRQAAIGSRQYMDPLDIERRTEYDKGREACDRLHHYATPLDEDADHSAKSPGKWGPATLGC